MHVASLELSRTLFELSGWKNTSYCYYANAGEFEGFSVMRSMVIDKPENLPAYDLGYLLRKLPQYIEYWDGGNEAGYLELTHWSKHWSCGYKDTYGSGKELMINMSDTPEDAAAKLAIELFKQGTLQPNLQESEK